MPEAAPFVYKYIQETDLVYIPVISEIKMTLHMWIPSLFTPIIQRNTVKMTIIVFVIFFIAILIRTVVDMIFDDFDATLLRYCEGIDERPLEPKNEGYKEVGVTEKNNSGIENNIGHEDGDDDNETENTIELQEKELV